MASRSRSFVVALTALALGACGGDTSSETGSGGGTGGGASASTTTTASTSNAGGSGGGNTSSTANTGGATSTSTASTGGAPPVCEESEVGGPETKVTLGTVKGKLVDVDGAPVAKHPAQACGLDICIFGVTDDAGNVFMNVAQDTGNKPLTMPAFKYGDGITHGRFAQLLPQEPVIDAGTVTTVKFPAAGADMKPGGKAASSGVELEFAANALIEVDIVNYGEDDQQKFRAGLLPKDKYGPAIPATLDIVYAVAPLETVFCPPAKVTVPNTASLPAGAAVQFWVHGTAIGQEHASYGTWNEIAKGHVSADGASISTDDGEGLPSLLNIGISVIPSP